MDLLNKKITFQIPDARSSCGGRIALTDPTTGRLPRMAHFHGELKHIIISNMTFTISYPLLTMTFKSEYVASLQIMASKLSCS